jgi:deoxyribodipyrimidine photolyase-related protein
MANFYKEQRRRLGILMDPSGNPEGDRWSFDELNRKKLPKDVQPPPRPSAPREAVVDEVVPLVKRVFPDHPGDAGEFEWPVTREASLDWLQHFVDQRLANFGPYEDAITTRSETVFHSMLSPLINVGLITPDEVVATVIASARAQDVPIQSLEGFVRQVIGWREFIRGVYREYGEQQAASNFFAHERELADCWYTGDTGIPILDDTIQSVLQNGWVHHIPRLMVIANLMNLCEVRPETAHRWFMEMFVDSAEWVMGPNVYGMGLFSDGGVFATKPYLCGSNYLLKMSDYRRGPWCDAVDGLYWRFIDKHRSFFLSNPRLSLMVGALDRMADDRRERIFGEAEAVLARVTVSS